MQLPSMLHILTFSERADRASLRLRRLESWKLCKLLQQLGRRSHGTCLYSYSHRKRTLEAPFSIFPPKPPIYKPARRQVRIHTRSHLYPQNANDTTARPSSAFPLQPLHPSPDFNGNTRRGAKMSGERMNVCGATNTWQEHGGAGHKAGRGPIHMKSMPGRPPPHSWMPLPHQLFGFRQF